MTASLWLSVLFDVIVLFLITYAIVRGYTRGFMKTVYHLLFWILCIGLTYLLYPYMAKLLGSLGVPETMERFVRQFITLPDLSGADSNSVIASLSIPDVLKNRLIENNNYEVYNILGADSLAGYIVGYIANMLVNALSIVLTFVILFCLGKALTGALSVIDRLPVIHFLNRTLGVLCGIVFGVLRVWIFCLILTVVGALAQMEVIFPAISSSLLTNIFYNHNILLDALLRIFGF